MREERMTDKEFTIWGLEQWEELMKNKTEVLEQAVEEAADEYRRDMMSKEALPVFSVSDYIKNKAEQENIPNRFRLAWVHSDPKDPRKWPGLREQLRGIESFLYRDVIRWKYRQKLLSYAEEMGLIRNDLDPINGVEAWGAVGEERWMIIPKEELKDEDVETLKEFLKVEE